MTSKRRQKVDVDNDAGFNSIFQSPLHVEFDKFVALEKRLILNVDKSADFCNYYISRDATAKRFSNDSEFCRLLGYRPKLLLKMSFKHFSRIKCLHSELLICQYFNKSMARAYYSFDISVKETGQRTGNDG